MELNKVIDKIEKGWYKLQEGEYEDAESVPFDELLEVVRKVLERENKKNKCNDLQKND